MTDKRTITYADYGLPTISNEAEELEQLREFYKIITDCAADEELVEELDNGTCELQGGNELGVRIDLGNICLMLGDYYTRKEADESEDDSCMHNYADYIDDIFVCLGCGEPMTGRPALDLIAPYLIATSAIVDDGKHHRRGPEHDNANEDIR